METLKVYGIYLAADEPREEIIADLSRFIDDAYNERRLHSALGYLNPSSSRTDALASRPK